MRDMGGVGSEKEELRLKRLKAGGIEIAWPDVAGWMKRVCVQTLRLLEGLFEGLLEGLFEVYR